MYRNWGQPLKKNALICAHPNDPPIAKAALGTSENKPAPILRIPSARIIRSVSVSVAVWVRRKCPKMGNVCQIAHRRRPTHKTIPHLERESRAGNKFRTSYSANPMIRLKPNTPIQHPTNRPVYLVSLPNIRTATRNR